MSQSAAAPQQNPVITNLQQRSAFIAGSKMIRKTLSTVTIAAGQSSYAIPLNNQGALIAIDLEVELNISAVAAAVPQAGAPYSFFSNINFVDQGNITRHSLSARALYDYMSFRSTKGSPYNAAVSLAEGGATNGNISYPSVPSLAAGGTGTVKFLMHIPIAKSWTNTAGMVLLQTGNNNQPAVLNLTLTNKLAGTGDSPYSTAISITGGTITPHQCYYQPLMSGGLQAPQIDTTAQWALTESLNDTTNIQAAAQKQVLFQTQFLTSAVGIRYFNGTDFTFGTDMTSVLLQANGGTFNLDDDDPQLRFLRYRNARGFDCAPGLYWFDFQNSPLLDAQVGVYSATFDIATAGSGSYMNYLYDWLKMPTQLYGLPGISQIA